MQKLDSDGNGTVTLQEWLRYLWEHMKELERKEVGNGDKWVKNLVSTLEMNLKILQMEKHSRERDCEEEDATEEARRQQAATDEALSSHRDELEEAHANVVAVEALHAATKAELKSNLDQLVATNAQHTATQSALACHKKELAQAHARHAEFTEKQHEGRHEMSKGLQEAYEMCIAIQNTTSKDRRRVHVVASTEESGEEGHEEAEKERRRRYYQEENSALAHLQFPQEGAKKATRSIKPGGSHPPTPTAGEEDGLAPEDGGHDQAAHAAVAEATSEHRSDTMAMHEDRHDASRHYRERHLAGAHQEADASPATPPLAAFLAARAASEATPGAAANAAVPWFKATTVSAVAEALSYSEDEKKRLQTRLQTSRALNTCTDDASPKKKKKPAAETDPVQPVPHEQARKSATPAGAPEEGTVPTKAAMAGGSDEGNKLRERLARSRKPQGRQGES